MQEGKFVDTIEKAIHEAKFADKNNGMATVPFTVKMEKCYLEVIRKSSSLDYPSVMLFKVIPINGKTVNYDELSDTIVEAMGIYGDISLEFTGEPKGTPIKTCVIDFSIV